MIAGGISCRLLVLGQHRCSGPGQGLSYAVQGLNVKPELAQFSAHVG
jgi:hypothetical protein